MKQHTMKKKSKQPIPGFSLCNQSQCNVKESYMHQHGEKIQELFRREENEDCIDWPTEVLEELITENEAGFFVTDLEQLQDLTNNIIRLICKGRTDFIPYLKKIISLSMVPFRKISNGDDRRCFHHIGGFFCSLCPVIKLQNPELQLEAAKAIHWFSQNCGPLNTNTESTFSRFYPQTDDIAYYSFIPSQLHCDEVIQAFVSTFTELLNDLAEKPCSSDVIAYGLKSLFQFVIRGQAKSIPPEFIKTILNFIINFSDISNSNTTTDDAPICCNRVLAEALLFFDSFIQEHEQAMQLCCTQQIVSTIWSIFTDSLFSSFKNVQKRIRNEFLGLLIEILGKTDLKTIEKASIAKIFDLLQSISLLIPDVAVTFTYSFKPRKLRLTHEEVDIELIIRSQELALIIRKVVPAARPEFIQHQVDILNGKINKYLAEQKYIFTILALQLLYGLADIEMFAQSGGPEVIKSMINPDNETQLDVETLFNTLLLMLKLYPVFQSPETVSLLLSQPRDNEQIISVMLSILAVIMQDHEEIALAFEDQGGVDLLVSCFKMDSAEVVSSAVDCARSIAPFVLSDISQRFVFMLLDFADSAQPLLRYAYVGLFLDLIQYQPFIEAAELWRSLKTNSNVQRTIVKWWKEEEERLDIRYDKGIIIDIDKPLDGHPLVSHSIRKVVVDKKWLLDRNSLTPAGMPYKLDFRARLYLFLKPFPELRDEDCKPTDRIKELMIRQYKDLKKGSVWLALKDELHDESIKPLHDDKEMIGKKLEKMRSRSLDIQEKQCEIWQKCENDRLALETRTYEQLSEGLKTAQFVAENYKAIVNSQPIAIARPYQGRTVKGEDVLVKASNLRMQAKQEIRAEDQDSTDAAEQREKEMKENYINDCLKDESISYLVQLMKSQQAQQEAEDPPIKEEAVVEISQ